MGPRSPRRHQELRSGHPGVGVEDVVCQLGSRNRVPPGFYFEPERVEPLRVRAFEGLRKLRNFGVILYSAVGGVIAGALRGGLLSSLGRLGRR